MKKPKANLYDAINRPAGDSRASAARRALRIFILASLLSFPASRVLLASEAGQKSTIEDQRSVSITVYNTNLGLVKDVRSLKLPKGVISLTFEGVASRIDPTSVHIRSLDYPQKLSILEQNFEFDLISPAKLMGKYLGREIELVTKDEKGEKVRKAKLIGIESGYVYEIDGKIAVNPDGKVVLPSLPEGLISKPSLIWLLENGEKKHTVEASYLTAGMHWRANYVAVLAEDDKKAELSGWVTINNRSGATYRDASLKLIAGDVHRVSPPMMGDRMRVAGKRVMVSAAEDAFAEKAFFEYHMYTLQRRTTLKNNQTKQIRLMEAGEISVEKKFVYAPRFLYFFSLMRDPEKDTKVGVYLSLKNSKQNNLGIPLPKGVVRVFKKDEDGALEFLGEDEIDHTPENEKIRIKIGNAFDVVADRVQTDFKKYKNTFETAYKISIRNHKEEDIIVSVIERLSGDWKIKEKTHDYIKESATRIRFDVPVIAKGKAELMYRVVIKR